MYSLYVFHTARRAAAVPASDIEVRLQAVPAAPAAVAGFLVAAEWGRRVELVERIGPHHAGPQPGGHPQDPRSLVGPDPRGQPVRSVVGLLHGLTRGAEGQHGPHQPEDPLPG